MVAQSAQTTSAVATLSGYADANYPAILVAYSGIVVFHTGSGS
jgi:hypothetical protein